VIRIFSNLKLVIGLMSRDYWLDRSTGFAVDVVTSWYMDDVVLTVLIANRDSCLQDFAKTELKWLVYWSVNDIFMSLYFIGAAWWILAGSFETRWHDRVIAILLSLLAAKNQTNSMDIGMNGYDWTVVTDSSCNWLNDDIISVFTVSGMENAPNRWLNWQTDDN